MPTRLTELQTADGKPGPGFVSLVRAGANQRRKWAFTKSADPAASTSADSAAPKEIVMNPKKLAETLEKAFPALKAEIAKAIATGDDAAQIAALTKLAESAESPAAKIEKLERELVEAKKTQPPAGQVHQPAPLGDEPKPPPAKKDDEAPIAMEDDVDGDAHVEHKAAYTCSACGAKNDVSAMLGKSATIAGVAKAEFEKLPAAVQKSLKDAHDRVVSLEKAQREAVEKENLRVHTAKARGLKAIPALEPVAFGKTLATLHKAAPKEAAEIVALLEGVNAFLAEEGKLVKEIGKAGGDDGASAEVELDRKAGEIMKSDPSLSKAKAVQKALEADPKLYERYERESMQR